MPNKILQFFKAGENQSQLIDQNKIDSQYSKYRKVY